eukprot:gene25186-biopygen2977
MPCHLYLALHRASVDSVKNGTLQATFTVPYAGENTKMVSIRTVRWPGLGQGRGGQSRRQWRAPRPDILGVRHRRRIEGLAPADGRGDRHGRRADRPRSPLVCPETVVGKLPWLCLPFPRGNDMLEPPRGRFGGGWLAQPFPRGGTTCCCSWEPWKSPDWGGGGYHRPSVSFARQERARAAVRIAARKQEIAG